MTRLRQVETAIAMLPDMEQRPDGLASVLEELDLDIAHVELRFTSSQRWLDRQRSILWTKRDANGWITGAIRIDRVLTAVAWPTE